MIDFLLVSFILLNCLGNTIKCGTVEADFKSAIPMAVYNTF